MLSAAIPEKHYLKAAPKGRCEFMHILPAEGAGSGVKAESEDWRHWVCLAGLSARIRAELDLADGI